MPVAPRRKGKATNIAESILGTRKKRKNSSVSSDRYVNNSTPSIEETNRERLRVPSY